MKHDLETYVRIDGHLRRIHIELDVDQLAYWLGKKALDNKGLESKAFYGALKVKVIE